MRIQAVQRMNEGEHPSDVAASMGMHRSWAYKCRASAQEEGLDALRSTRASGRPRRLTPAQEREVREWIDGRRPDQHELGASLWTRQLVQGLLLSRFGVRLSLASVGALLARLGLSVGHPLDRLQVRHPEAARQWREVIYPEVLVQARCERGEALFWDEWVPAGAAFADDAAGGGSVPTLPPMLACAVSAKGAFWLVGCAPVHTDAAFIALIETFMQGRRQPVHLVLEALPQRCTEAVQQHVRGTQGALTLHFLPL